MPITTNETWQEFRSKCVLAVDNLKHCIHSGNTVNGLCIDDKKYCPRIKKPVKKAVTGWRADFSEYLAKHDEMYRNVIQNVNFVTPLEQLYPDIDIRCTLEQSKEYWRDQFKGYKLKCKSDTAEIDWESTYKKGVQIAVAKNFAIKKPKKSGGW